MMRLRFAPPRRSDTAPGSMPLTVRALYGEHPATTAEEQGTLEIGVFRDLAMELLPHTSSGRFFAEHQVTIQNRGNAPARLLLDAATHTSPLVRYPAPEVDRWPWAGDRIDTGSTSALALARDSEDPPLPDHNPRQMTESP
jgi:hypothetical protein